MKLNGLQAVISRSQSPSKINIYVEEVIAKPQSSSENMTGCIGPTYDWYNGITLKWTYNLLLMVWKTWVNLFLLPIFCVELFHPTYC